MNSFFFEWTNNITTYIDDGINVLNKNLCQYKIMTSSSPTVRTVLAQSHENFVVVQIDKATNNVALTLLCLL